MRSKRELELICISNFVRVLYAIFFTISTLLPVKAAALEVDTWVGAYDLQDVNQSKFFDGEAPIRLQVLTNQQKAQIIELRIYIFDENGSKNTAIIAERIAKFRGNRERVVRPLLHALFSSDRVVRVSAARLLVSIADSTNVCTLLRAIFVSKSIGKLEIRSANGKSAFDLYNEDEAGVVYNLIQIYSVIWNSSSYASQDYFSPAMKLLAEQLKDRNGYDRSKDALRKLIDQSGKILPNDREPQEAVQAVANEICRANFPNFK